MDLFTISTKTAPKSAPRAPKPDRQFWRDIAARRVTDQLIPNPDQRRVGQGYRRH